MYPVLHAGRLAPVAAALAAAGTACLLTALVTRGRLVGAALFALAGAYVAADVGGQVPTASVIAYAAGLIAVAELTLWSARLPRAATADRAVVVTRLAALAAVAAAAALLALAVLAAASLRPLGALEAAVVGSAAAAALLALPWLLLRVWR